MEAPRHFLETTSVKIPSVELVAASSAHTWGPAEKRRRVAASGDAARYALRGVSADKGDVHAAIKHVDKGLFPGAFCKVVPDHLTGSPDHCVVMHADGAGTKSSLAYAYWRKTGDVSVWRGIAQDSLVMNLDDLLCVGITDNILVSSTIGRNKNNISKEVIAEIIAGNEALLEELRRQGMSILSTGGETADVGDLVRTVIVDSTVTARVPRTDIIDNARIAAGDVIVGLSSSGQATYEAVYNSGIGSNGLTSARHDVFGKQVADEFPECFDPAVPKDLAFSGPHGLDDLVDGDDGTRVPVGKLVLSPTRTYAPIVKRVLQAGLREKIKGMIHCSGGGQTKVLHFVDGVNVVKDRLFPVPAVFRLIQRCSGTPWQEMYKVFNMGHRMEFYTDSDTADAIIGISKSFSVDAQVVGRVESGTPGSKGLLIKTEHGEFEY